MKLCLTLSTLVTASHGAELQPWISVPVIETKRLQFRELEGSDVSALKQILSDPDVMAFSCNGVMSGADTEAFIGTCRVAYQLKGYGQWAILEKTSGTLIGFCGLSDVVIGY